MKLSKAEKEAFDNIRREISNSDLTSLQKFILKFPIAQDDNKNDISLPSVYIDFYSTEEKMPFFEFVNQMVYKLFYIEDVKILGVNKFCYSGASKWDNQDTEIIIGSDLSGDIYDFDGDFSWEPFVEKHSKHPETSKF